MYFTLVFKNNSNEGPTVSYDVCFHPCAVWYNNGEEVLIPNSEVPSYKKGYLSALISKESESGFIKKDFSNFNQILVICHEQGHGDENDLKNLLADIKQEDFSYIVSGNQSI